MKTKSELQTERRNLLDQAHSIATKAKARDSAFTAAERAEVDRLLAGVDGIDTELKNLQTNTKSPEFLAQAREDEARFARLANIGEEGLGAKGYLRLSAKAVGESYTRTMANDLGGQKSLLDAGTTIVPVQIGSGSPIDQGRPAQGLLDVLPVRVVAREFAYLRQTTRTNAAAFVAPGALKPTSAYTLGRFEDRLRVLAHLSEPIDRFWIEDMASLQQFVADELAYGLQLGLENAVLNGDGVGENLTGLKNVSGIQTQAYATSPILTARTALTKVETIFGESPSYYVFHPSDWEKIETTTLSGGQYVFGEAGAAVPVDRVQRRLWGQPVALSLVATVGTGWLVNQDAASLYTDGRGLRLDWASPGDDFERNQLRARAEARFGLAVTRPNGVVKIALAAA